MINGTHFRRECLILPIPLTAELPKIYYYETTVRGACHMYHCFYCGTQPGKTGGKVTKQGDEIVIPMKNTLDQWAPSLIVHEDHSDPVVHVDVTYHVGSARERLAKSGFAHFFEQHMMFQGSDHVLMNSTSRSYLMVGGTLNGSTKPHDRTNYYETVPSNQLEKCSGLKQTGWAFCSMLLLKRNLKYSVLPKKNEKRAELWQPSLRSCQWKPLQETLSLWSSLFMADDWLYGRPEQGGCKWPEKFFLRWYGPNNAMLP